MKKIEIHPEAVEKIKKFTLNETQLGFGKYVCPIMIEGIYDKGDWQSFHLVPYGPISLDPCSKVLHYAQEIFEGMKAYKHSDGSVWMFRPEMNARRFNYSARRMAMPEIPEDIFLSANELIVAYCKNVIPRRSGESLYLRPFMIGTEVGLGVKPSKQFLFLIVASPSGNYFSSDAVKVYIEREEVRSVKGGLGSAKAGANYAASLHSYEHTHKLGCDQTMWLDAIERKYIEEMSGMNFFAVINNTLYTPELTDTILDGVTRRSIIELAKLNKLGVVEKKLSIDEVIEAAKKGECTEAFVCGTAAVIVPVASFTEKDGTTYRLRDAGGKIGEILKERLINIQSGKEEAPNGWMYPVKNLEF